MPTTRTARCACGRVEITVRDDPLMVGICHCDFCQKRTGSVFSASAHFAEDQIAAVTGETKVYNGLEVDGVGVAEIPGGIDYHFCPTCGSTLFASMISPLNGQRVFGVAVGNFEDPEFPAPTTEYFTKFRHRWVVPVPGAVQLPDPRDGSVSLESAMPSLGEDSESE